MNSKENEFNEWHDLSSDIEEHFKECVEPLFKPNEIPSLNYVLDMYENDYECEFAESMDTRALYIYEKVNALFKDCEHKICKIE